MDKVTMSVEDFRNMVSDFRNTQKGLATSLLDCVDRLHDLDGDTDATQEIIRGAAAAVGAAVDLDEVLMLVMQRVKTIEQSTETPDPSLN
jgi:predicted RecB family endonuclease